MDNSSTAAGTRRVSTEGNFASLSFEPKLWCRVGIISRGEGPEVEGTCGISFFPNAPFTQGFQGFSSLHNLLVYWELSVLGLKNFEMQYKNTIEKYVETFLTN